MCLETGMKYAAITDKDIICYKCVNPGEINGLHLHEFGSFYSFYYHFTYEVGKEYEEKKFKNRPEKDIFGRRRFVNNGFHSFKYLRDARIECSSYSIILKCVIPAGSRYFYGIYNFLYNTYCSDKLKIVAWRTRDGKWN